MYSSKQSRSRRRWVKLIFATIVLVGLGATGFFIVGSTDPDTPEEIIQARLSFDASVTDTEQQVIADRIEASGIEITSPVTVSAAWSYDADNSIVLDVFIPTTDVYAVTQGISLSDLSTALVDQNVDNSLAQSLGSFIADESQAVDSLAESSSLETGDSITVVPLTELDITKKLVALNGRYYLDEFTSGAIFRTVSFSGEGAGDLQSFTVETLDESQVFKTNITGVTALTREMQNKLAEVGDPLFFSENIGDFLADADLTHVSNEVSFRDNCRYSRTLFCSPPEFIETLKASGVDLVELTGNHNNDLGADLNAATIELYRSLGWGTVGGGLNAVDAAQPFTTTQDGTALTFLAYNFPDSPNGGAIAGPERAGANSFDFAKIEADIETAKQTTDYVIVSVQYWECYAYPNGYVEFPECDAPIGEQEKNFKRIIDLGADMVVGSSAHQPQTWEYYEGKPIYYGLGNMYFDQTQWPGTERGIVLSNYFVNGELLQTKLTPTVFNKDFQPRVMNTEEAAYQLQRLNDAR